MARRVRIQTHSAKKVWLIQFGQFMLEFATIEMGIFGLLVKTSGIKIEAARAILSGVRVDQSIGFIRRLVEIREDDKGFPNTEALRDLEVCFSQLNEINKVRNSLVHHGATLKPNEFTTSNAFGALSRARSQSFKVSPQDLHAMTVDLRKIRSLIVYHMYAHDIPQVRDEHREEYKRMKAPWRYIPQSPTTNDPKPLDRSPKRSRQPGS